MVVKECSKTDISHERLQGGAEKGKKGKDKGKGKRESIPEPRKSSELPPLLPPPTPVQMSITEFLKRFALTHADEDEWTWESYSASSASITEVAKEEPIAEPEVPAKGKKGKKERKGSRREKEPEPPPPEEDTGMSDIMAEINRMKAMADAQVLADSQTVEEEAPVKKPKKPKPVKEPLPEGAEPPLPKKKLSKKERQRLALEMAEQAKIQAEIAAKKAEDEERIRKIEERKAAIEKEKRDAAEQKLRAEQLNSSLNNIAHINKINVDKGVQERATNEWNQYLKCDGLPDPFVCGQMNTYLHLWEHTLESTTIDVAAERSIEVLKLLDILTNFIDDPVGVEQRTIDNWIWIQRLFREHQQLSLDIATYKILRDIDINMNFVNIQTSDYHRKEDSFAVCLWISKSLPTPMPNPRRPRIRPRIQLEFPELDMNVIFPETLEYYCLAIRAMYVKYDHLSDLTYSFWKPNCPELFSQDLYNATLQEHYSKLHYKYEQHYVKQPGAEDPPPKKPKGEVVDKTAGIIPIVPYQKLEPTASTYVISVEDDLYVETRKKLMTRVEPNVINLRQFIIIGGTYSLDLYYSPPQPAQKVSLFMQITRLSVPKFLAEVPFYIEYEPPPSHDSSVKRAPEEIEAELKAEEEKLSKLMLISLKLPEHVMWLDVPIACYWDRKKKVWTKADVHDFKHIEESGMVQFRTGRFGSFAFAINRYANFPFQAWEMKPETNGSVTFQLTAAILMVEFNIKDKLICIAQLQNGTNKCLKRIMGVYFKLPRLARILIESGIDFFPSFDAFCYIEGTCEKHWPMEKHLYYNMAQLCTCYNFAWSRWNITAGRRNIVMQMREYKPERTKQMPHSMLLVNPLKAVYIDCTEVSQFFSEEHVEGMFFYSDLYTLMKGTCNMALRAKVQSAKPELIGTIAQFLIMTRVLSLS